MTTYTATAGETGVMPKGLSVGLSGVSVAFDVSTLSNTAATVLTMAKIPKGARVLFLSYGCAGGKMACVLGDSVSSTRYKSTETISAGMGMIMAKTFNQNYVYSAEDTIFYTVSLSSLAGIMYLNAIYGLDTGV